MTQVSNTEDDNLIKALAEKNILPENVLFRIQRDFKIRKECELLKKQGLHISEIIIKLSEKYFTGEENIKRIIYKK